jgi:hypothetical protein
MGNTQDVGIAVTLKVDKLIRDTLKSLPMGHESTKMLDEMKKGERDGWVLYHHDNIKWYIHEDLVVRNVHYLLESIGTEDGRDEEVVYLIIQEEIPEGVIERVGGHEDPFNLGYDFRLKYDLEAPTPPPTRTSKEEERAWQPKRKQRGRRKPP